jgi:protein-tyrosine-phosphatase
MAETILRHLSRGRVDVRSAGSDPRPEINPLAREAVKRVFGLEMTGQRPKSVAELAPERFDCVITVCDRAAEACPTFPGAPEVLRWSLPDPAEAAGTDEERLRTFENTAKDLMQRSRLWLALPAVARRMAADSPAVRG